MKLSQNYSDAFVSRSDFLLLQEQIKTLKKKNLSDALLQIGTDRSTIAALQQNLTETNSALALLKQNISDAFLQIGSFHSEILAVEQNLSTTNSALSTLKQNVSMSELHIYNLKTEASLPFTWLIQPYTPYAGQPLTVNLNNIPNYPAAIEVLLEARFSPSLSVPAALCRFSLSSAGSAQRIFSIGAVANAYVQKSMTTWLPFFGNSNHVITIDLLPGTDTGGLDYCKSNMLFQMALLGMKY